MASRFGGGTRKQSWVEEEQEATRLTRELADPRRKKIRIRHARSGGRTQAAEDGSASLALYEDGKERVEDLDAAEWGERERSAAHLGSRWRSQDRLLVKVSRSELEQEEQDVAREHLGRRQDEGPWFLRQ